MDVSLKNAGTVLINGNAPTAFPATHTAEVNLQVSLTAVPGGYFTFTGWTGLVNTTSPNVRVQVQDSYICANFTGTFGTISGTVFSDDNEDGTRQESEEGLYGMGVSVINDQGVQVAAGSTVDGGAYYLTVRDPGPYTAVFAVPDGAHISPLGPDSQADPATGEAGLAELTMDDRDATANAGLVGAVSIYPPAAAAEAPAKKADESGGGGCFLGALLQPVFAEKILGEPFFCEKRKVPPNPLQRKP